MNMETFPFFFIQPQFDAAHKGNGALKMVHCCLVTIKTVETKDI